MSAHDKKCEVILWKNNLWSACWCHERALEAEVERLTQSLLIERGKLEKADEENERLRTALSMFTEHMEVCSINLGGVCTCGTDEARAALAAGGGK